MWDVLPRPRVRGSDLQIGARGGGGGVASANRGALGPCEKGRWRPPPTHHLQVCWTSSASRARPPRAVPGQGAAAKNLKALRSLPRSGKGSTLPARQARQSQTRERGRSPKPEGSVGRILPDPRRGRAGCLFPPRASSSRTRCRTRPYALPTTRFTLRTPHGTKTSLLVSR